jgi:Carboxypeptidase regulatory-like domain
MRHPSIFASEAALSIFTLLMCLLTIAGQTQAQVRGDKGGPQAEWTSTWNGPFTCEAVNASTAADLAHITTNNELRLNYTPPTTVDSFTYTAASGSKPRVLIGTADTGNSVTTDNSSDSTSLNWTSTKAIGAVLVGGSGGNRLYWMPEGMALGMQFSGTGFRNPSGSTITKVAFCYHEPATVTIIKEAQSPSGLSSVSFPFSTTNLGTSSFSLVDNNNIGPDRHVISNLYSFAKWGDYNITVTESLFQNWTLSSLTCVETDTITTPAQSQYATTVNLAARKATIKLEEGEKVTCTYKNTPLNPTSAMGSISGRVTDSYGLGISGATIRVVDASSGTSNAVRSNSSGFYSFDDLPLSEFYLVTVEHKRYSFADNVRTFTLIDDLVGLNFVANP